jgi:hypothetical protein
MTFLNPPPLSHLLWSTRGKEWGFRFLHTPVQLLDYRDQIYESIFMTDEGTPLSLYGNIYMAEGKMFSYVACRFFDSGGLWIDAAGREIPHELLLVLDSTSLHEEVIFSNWHEIVMAHLRDAYRQAYINDPATIDISLFDVNIDWKSFQKSGRTHAHRKDLCLPIEERMNVPPERCYIASIVKNLLSVFNIDIRDC